VLLITFSLVLTVVIGELADCCAKPHRPVFSGGWYAIFWRAALIASIWLLAFGLTGRALFAAVATFVTIAVIVTISNIKLRYLQEPLVFSDFALLEHILKHPHLFYIPRRWQGAAVAGLAVLLTAIIGWVTIEPRAVGWSVQFCALALAAIVPAAVLLRPSVAAQSARLVRNPKPHDDIARIGLLTSLLAYIVAWRLEPSVVPGRYSDVSLPMTLPYDAVVVVQAESFIDLRRLGRTEVRLPTFDRLRQRAISTGLVEVACEGAYTLRPESSVITGLGFGEQGFDRFHPYLRPHRFATSALPRLLNDAGWDTLFVHPHDGRFFRRVQAMAAFGFKQFADERSFVGALRVGPYVCDAAVGQFLAKELAPHAARTRPLFVYAVTMEAHDPYGPGRLPGQSDPSQQYIHHIENADCMLGELADTLDCNWQRVLLVFFGDHVPFLPSFADPFPDKRTDYLAVELGKNAIKDRLDFEVTRPEHLHALILGRLKSAAN
jgi:hypothetical protein